MEYFLGQVVDGNVTITELLDQDNLPPTIGSNIEITLLDAKENYDMILIPIFHTEGSGGYISYSLLVTEGEQYIEMPLGYYSSIQYSHIKFNGGTSATILYLDVSGYLPITHIYGINF